MYCSAANVDITVVTKHVTILFSVNSDTSLSDNFCLAFHTVCSEKDSFEEQEISV